MNFDSEQKIREKIANYEKLSLKLAIPIFITAPLFLISHIVWIIGPLLWVFYTVAALCLFVASFVADGTVMINKSKFNISNFTTFKLILIKIFVFFLNYYLVIFINKCFMEYS